MVSAPLTKTVVFYLTRMSLDWYELNHRFCLSAVQSRKQELVTLRLRRNDDADLYISRIGCLHLCKSGVLLRHSWLAPRLDAGACYVCVSVAITKRQWHNSPHNTNARQQHSTHRRSSQQRHVGSDDSRQFTIPRCRCWWRCWQSVGKMVVVDRQCNIHHRINNRKH